MTQAKDHDAGGGRQGVILAKCAELQPSGNEHPWWLGPSTTTGPRLLNYSSWAMSGIRTSKFRFQIIRSLQGQMPDPGELWDPVGACGHELLELVSLRATIGGKITLALCWVRVQAAALTKLGAALPVVPGQTRARRVDRCPSAESIPRVCLS
jgi:hypothetical protein